MSALPPDLRKRGVTGLRVSETAGWLVQLPGRTIVADELNTARDWLRQRRRPPKQHQLMALFGEARAPPE